MSADNEVQSEAAVSASANVKLDGIYAFKVGMSTVFSDTGEAIPVTVLKYEPAVVSQVKNAQADGYAAVQLAFCPKKAKNTSKAMASNLSKAGFAGGAKFVREIRQSQLPEEVAVGQKVSIESLAKGDVVQISARSKGRGFAGVVKRHGFGGGPGAHGSGFHRAPGSVGNRTWPGRVMKGRRLPGHMGDKLITVKGVEVVEVLPEENVVLVKGPVPGARNNLVKLIKQ